MKFLSLLTKNKQPVQTILLFAQVLSPVVMYFGIRTQTISLIFIGLVALILANLIAALIK